MKARDSSIDCYLKKMFANSQDLEKYWRRDKRDCLNSNQGKSILLDLESNLDLNMICPIGLGEY